MKQRIEQPGQSHNQNAADEIEPQVGQVGESVTAYYQNFGNNGRIKSGRAADSFEIKGDQKNPQDGSVKKRPQDVHRLDERAQAVGIHGEGDGVQSPKDGGYF